MRVEADPEDISRLISHDNMALFAGIINDIIVASGLFEGITAGENMWLFELPRIMLIIDCKYTRCCRVVYP
jgi:hypothetical protein